MSEFILQGDGDHGHTLVSNLFLDNYMPEANGEYVKIYLYLLRCLKSDTQELSIELIANKFENTESDVRRALKYWERMKLLKLQYDNAENLTGIQIVNEPEAKMAELPAADCAVTTRSKPQPTPSAPSAISADSASPTTPSGTLPKDPLTPDEAQQLLFICEQYLGKPLSSTEVSKILDLHDIFGFSPSLIEYLVEYSISGGHKSIHYIEATARAWHQAGCTTVTQAREQVTIYNRAYFKILKAFGIAGRNPVDAEIACMDKWLKDYGFSLEVISEACSRTMAAIHQPSFPYTDKILASWKKQGVKSLNDIQSADRNRSDRKSQTEPASTAPKRPAAPNRFHNFQERDYDFKELEKQLINQ